MSGIAIGELHGGLYIGSRSKKPCKVESTDCKTCKHSYVTPKGSVTKLTRNDGSVMIQYGESSMCMDTSTTKRIDISDDGFICSAWEPKENQS